ncbi:MAG: helix-turn-helix domain-containing protein [Thermoplasmatales archaeon]|nr:helix-turn-helix domain-containing protein [Thermoplasmatales archaeon]
MAEKGKLGDRMKKYREQLGLSVGDLATNTGLKPAFIEDVETGKVYPPLGSIIKISRALGQRVGTFMDDQFVPDPVIVRAGARAEETSSHRGAGGHYRYFPLGKGKTDRHMEPLFIKIGEDEPKELSSHEGEEFIIVVSGKVLVKYGKEEHVLSAGDSAYYNSVVPHFIGAVGGPAEIYAVLYAPS